jgi:hypothetical protein
MSTDPKLLMEELKSKLDPDEKTECTLYGKCSGDILFEGLISITNKRLIFYNNETLRASGFHEIFGTENSTLAKTITLNILADTIIIKNIIAGSPIEFIKALWAKIPNNRKDQNVIKAIETASDQINEMKTKCLLPDIIYNYKRALLTLASQTKPKKPMGSKMIIFLSISSVVAAILIVMLIFVYANYKNITNRDSLTLDQYIGVTATDLLGKTNMGDSRFVNLYETDNMKRLVLNADENFTHEMIEDMCVLHTIKIMKELIRDEEFMQSESGLSIEWALELIDIYGNKENKVVLIIGFTKQSIKKIKWDNVLIDGLKRAADEYVIDDALAAD